MSTAGSGKMRDITKSLKAHYDETFRKHGPTVQGVDWGASDKKLAHRYDTMLSLLKETPEEQPVSILDVGCGYGGLALHMREKGVKARYTGLDIGEEMIDWARRNISGDVNFIVGDILSWRPEESFDYVICNGILTQKLNASHMEMDAYSRELIRKIFSLSRTGAAFNMMTNQVNFFADNLFYKSPVETLSWCLAELTPHVRMDHSYAGFDYTVYLYHEPVWTL